jgi:hypothetical protein
MAATGKEMTRLWCAWTKHSASLAGTAISIIDSVDRHTSFDGIRILT